MCKTVQKVPNDTIHFGSKMLTQKAEDDSTLVHVAIHCPKQHVSSTAVNVHNIHVTLWTKCEFLPPWNCIFTISMWGDSRFIDGYLWQWSMVPSSQSEFAFFRYFTYMSSKRERKIYWWNMLCWLKILWSHKIVFHKICIFFRIFMLPFWCTILVNFLSKTYLWYLILTCSYF